MSPIAAVSVAPARAVPVIVGWPVALFAVVTVAISELVTTPSPVPEVSPCPVTVRVKISPSPAVSAGIVTTGMALAASSNITPLVGPEVCLQL